VHVQVDLVDQPEIAANVQADLVDLVQVAQVAQELGQVDLVDLAQREIVQVDLVDLAQVAQVAQADLLAREQELQVQPAHQVVVQADVQMHQVVAAMQPELLVSLVADHQRVVSQSAQSVKSTTT
jgi:hypothetical protein